MARRKRKKTSRTAEDQARWDATTRLVQERIAYHSKMSELLGERKREQEHIAELEAERKSA